MAVPVTLVEPATTPPVIAGAIRGVDVLVGVDVAVGVIVAVTVAVREGVIVGDDVLVAVGELVGVLVAVPVALGVEVLVPVGVAVALGGAVLVAVPVGVIVGEFVAVPVGVDVPVGVFVPVAVDVGVMLGDGVGVGVEPTMMLPLPGVQGTGVSKAPGTIAKPQLVNCRALLPFACPWNVMLTMLIGGVGATGLVHANEQFTFPTGGVGAGVLQRGKQLVNGD
jgi:hypothetical protein